ncbi:ADYC domain-containing protein [Archangium sp.]|uniref:ADYC domain-containing protein n=1 Tax=Archangium sp. TaxID=1872627 RepID=UPI002D710F98|nr:ADYC domain-containing protein [Archangium sp.]HYO59105.1 ADYC domain-containing protein [Archangium sp.]
MVGMVGVVACGGEALVPLEEQSDESAAARGVRNGSNLNGSNLNGSNLNGSELNDLSLARMLVSVDYAGAWLEGSTFHGWYSGSHVSGMDFVQARFLGNLGEGGQVELRVDAITPGLGANQDVWTYRVSYREPTDGQWYPICRDASGQPADAIAVAGRWDYRQGLAGVGGAKYDDPRAFTFACEGAAIAKCIRLGYKPWASTGGVNLAAHHQACTRLIRADYCGDGTSHTVDGQWVNLYDAVGVQQDTESWGLEAEWDTEGARCFTEHNRAPAPVSCPGAPRKTECGTAEAFSSGTLLQSETP